MENSSQIGEIKTAFESEFRGCHLSYKEALFQKTLAHCFFLKLPSDDVLRENWVKISNFVALKFQNELENEFERWNVYLFFMLASEVHNDLKYLVENDTFSSRKIVITPMQDMDEIIGGHVLNSDLIIQSEVISEPTQIKKDPIIWEVLKDISPKKRLTDNIKDSLDQITERIKSMEEQ